jgi:hypothetical protein
VEHVFVGKAAFSLFSSASSPSQNQVIPLSGFRSDEEVAEALPATTWKFSGKGISASLRSS